MKIIAIVVTYNRLDLLKENVKCLLNQTVELSEIIIVNNASTDGTFDYCSNLEKSNDKITVCSLSENTGGSGGFSVAIQLAMEHNADYIWGMDDDAMPHKDALENMLYTVNIYDKKSNCCFSCNTYYMQDNNLMQKQFTEDRTPLEHLTFVGFFIPKSLVEKVGPPRADLFIYYDDLDYSLSIKEAGYKIIGVVDSIIEHPFIMPPNRKKILFFSINIPEMPSWKMYYWMRNNLLIRKKKNRNFIKTFFLEIYILLKLLLFKREQFCVAVKGFTHGMLNVSGHTKSMP